MKNERNETTELKLNATMTLNGLDVPLTATVDLLDYRVADAEAAHQMLSDDNAHLNAALNDVSIQFKRALDGHRSTMPAATAASIGGWE